MYQLLVIIAIVLLIIAISKIRRCPPEQRRKLTFRYGLYALAIIVTGMVITGRLHWLAAIIASTLPLLQRLLPFIIQALPFIKKQPDKTQAQATQTTMDVEQALKVFGLQQVKDEAQIIQRHRELMQKNHPDRGGSDYLAAQINEAKEVLLRALSSGQ